MSGSIPPLHAADHQTAKPGTAVPQPVGAEAGAGEYGAPDRSTLVSATRLPAWWQRFGQSHGELAVTEHPGQVAAHALDGARAVLQAPWPVAGGPGSGGDAVHRIASLAAQERSYAVLLVRRSGYAVGVCTATRVIASKTGSRYVQSRTAAGGWSQQRYARRRANQAGQLVKAVAKHAAALPIGSAQYLVLGGDAELAASVLAQPELAAWRKLEHLRFQPVKQPSRAALDEAAKAACAVFIRVWDPE